MRGALLGAVVGMFLALPAFASETHGTISADAKYAWGENIGWINFAPAEGGLTITDSAITGYAWSDGYGWINFSPANSGQGVANTPEGHVSGSAWIASLGWLDMQGVTISSEGKFTGVAGVEGSQVGRVSFDCAECDVRTDWRPTSAPPTDTGGDDGGGGGSNSSGSTGGGSGGASFFDGSYQSQIDALYALIAQLTARLKELQERAARNNALPERNLTIGSRGEDVKALQVLLIKRDIGSAAQALSTVGPTGFFSTLTRAALAEYQRLVGIVPAVGYFGPITRAFMKYINLPGLWW